MRRRHFLQGLSAGLMSTGLLAAAERGYRSLPARGGKRAETLGTARNCIFILLEGGPSHVDTFDIKTTRDTPDLLGIQTTADGLLWPAGVMPKLGEMTREFSLVRGISAVEAVHERAVYHLLTAHRQNAALTGEIPHFASMAAFKLAEQRRETDLLPSVILMGADPAQNGFLPVDYQAMRLSNEGTVPNLEHYYEGGEDRFALLNATLAMSNPSDARGDLLRFQKKGLELMGGGPLRDLLMVESTFEDPSYSVTEFRRQCETSLRLLEADQGTRMIQMQLGGWDHHDEIYSLQEGGLPDLCHALDEGLSYLLAGLAARPGSTPGNTLLDETLVVAMGEFGRTVGGLNTSEGRDHLPEVAPALFAGGGVQGGAPDRCHQQRRQHHYRSRLEPSTLHGHQRCGGYRLQRVGHRLDGTHCRYALGPCLRTGGQLGRRTGTHHRRSFRMRGRIMKTLLALVACLLMLPAAAAEPTKMDPLVQRFLHGPPLAAKASGGNGMETYGRIDDRAFPPSRYPGPDGPAARPGTPERFPGGPTAGQASPGDR